MSAADGEPLTAGLDSWLACSRHGAVAEVVLNRPERRNALAWGLVGQLVDLLDRAAADPGVRVVVLTGAGDAFSAGGDLKDLAERRARGTVERVSGGAAVLDALARIWNFPKPLIAAINGAAVGAGMGLALLCDIRLAARDARIAFPFARLGLSPDYGVSFTLPLVVGPGHASRLLFSGAELDGEQALAIGLVDGCVDGADLSAAALALAAGISNSAPFAVRLAKQALRRAHDGELRAALRAELNAQALATTTADQREGVDAVLERRSATFTDR
jgi:enoyl-CoA hydratase/carnithine racemase